MGSDEIRETFLRFFEERGHLRLPSASLVPGAHDPSTLLIIAGMQPLKPYFLGQQRAPQPLLTSCQKCLRTADIENVGNTARHLTFFEMLGNFSLGDYFKAGAVELAWELSLDGFGFSADDVWITVFAGDDDLGLGPDEEAIDAWLAVGVPRERIVALPREENFWQAGPTGPCGPCSELYLDRGVEHGALDDLPGGDNDRFLEYWNLVFMQYDQDPVGTLTPLPARNIDTGLGLNRMAAIQQDVPSVFETDQFRPLVELGEELSGRRYGADFAGDRGLRILADHSRAMTFLLADGVVPSNEDRGHVLRRIVRRAISHGRRLGIAPGSLPAFAERTIELMGPGYPELAEQRETIVGWLAAEEEGFGHTLELGTRLLDEIVARAQERGEEGIAAQDAFRLHDTYGFPIDLTLEAAAEHGLGVDERGFESLMEEQRVRARGAGRGGAPEAEEPVRESARELAGSAGFATEFTGFATLEQHTTLAAVKRADGRVLAKLRESPFYAAGGGQVSDRGVVECEAGDCRARVADVLRLGDDQVVALAPEAGELEPGAPIVARVDPAARHATAANHTATHLLHAALRRWLGTHVRQAGSSVAPDKLRFDFTHGSALSEAELADVEDEVNRWIVANHPVRALTTTLDEARRLGAMALFGEKYGDVVRMVEVGDGSFSRELCGGTHVRSTAEVGVFEIVSESSSASNVRRIEALTGPAGVDLLRRRDAALVDIAATLRTSPESAADVVRDHERRRRELERAARAGGGAAGAGADGTVDLEALSAEAVDVAGARVLVAAVPDLDAKAMPDLVDRLRGRLGDAAIVLGSAAGDRVSLVAGVAPALVARGVKAGPVVQAAARVAGGGGGGRDTMARAGGRDPSKLSDALAAARAAIDSALRG